MALANIAPQKMLDLHHLFQTGDWDTAAVIQRRLVPVNTAVTARFGIPGLKAALDIMGYYGGPVRSPLRSLNDADVESLKAILIAGELL
jgi:4-hydroxy-2-oxoglutarate aldolase